MSDYFAHETACIDDGAEIGEGTKIWHFSHVLPGARIGKNCSLGQNVVVSSTVVIGDLCKIQNNVSLYDGVTLERGVFCGPSCVFTNVTMPRSEYPRRNAYAPTLLRRGATIGANATIVCGSKLGRYCTIAAGAVVTGDVPDHALMAGVPARRIGWVAHSGEVLRQDMTCRLTGDVYEERGDTLARTVERSGIGL